MWRKRGARPWKAALGPCARLARCGSWAVRRCFQGTKQRPQKERDGIALRQEKTKLIRKEEKKENEFELKYVRCTKLRCNSRALSEGSRRDRNMAE